MGISFRQIVLVHRFLSKTTLPSTILAVASTLLIAFCVSTFLFRKWRERSIVREDETGVVDVQLRPVTQVWPPDDYKGPIDFDVVFFHGFQFGQDAHNMWKTTWSTRNRPETCWPQEWLGPQLGNNVRILLLSYDAYATKSKSHEFGNTEDVSDIAKNLVQNVVISSQWKLGQEHPFVLVGHSFGGIVIESLVIEIHKISQQHSSNLEKRDVEKANVFLKNMAGVAFYAVPHVGSRQLIEYICRQCEINLPSKQLAQVNKAIILENIDPSISKAADLSNDFFNTLASCTNVYGVIDFIETKPIDDNVGMIVEYRPAQISGHRCYRVEGCDHFSVCKPLDQNHPSYNMLVRFLEGCQKDFLLKPASLPTLPKLVIGRDEAIANVKGKIVDNHMLAVIGMGGIGKTTLEITPVHDLNPKCTSTNPELVVIFFHGIGYGENDDWKETWTSTTSEGKRVCWPQEWLPADLATQNVNNVRILSLSYDSALLGANEHATDIGKNLVESLVSKSEYEPLWEAPIVLVGYSFGGLVVKSLVVEVDKRVNARTVNTLEKQAKQSCNKFLNNLKGTIFYGVPHTGGGEDFKQFFVRECQKSNEANKKRIAKSGILKNIEGFNRQMEELSVDFEIAADPTLIIYAFGEGRPVRRGESVLVPYASAQYLARRNHYKVEDATHITICQPTSRQAINYSLLKDVLAVVMEGTQRRTTPQSKPPLSQLRFLNTPSEISSSSNTTPYLDDLR